MTTVQPSIGQVELPPPKVELAGQTLFKDGAQDFSMCNFGSNIVICGPNQICDIIVRLFPATIENNFCKDCGFVVSKNATILKLKRAVQGNNLCLKVSIRASSKFRIRFFDKELRILDERLIEVISLSDPSFTTIFEKLDSTFVNSTLPLPSEPFALQTVLDANQIIRKNKSITFPPFQLKAWRTTLKKISTCGELWNLIKRSANNPSIYPVTPKYEENPCKKQKR